MQTTVRILAVFLLVGFGYAVGTMRLFEPEVVRAQPTAEKTSKEKIREAYKSLEAAQQMLEQSGKYKRAINGVNAFAVTVGGVDAVRDLEDGTGVDPETFAALYAGQATDEVAAKLKKNEHNHLTYNKKVIRLYSIDKLKKLYRKRAEIVGIKSGLPSPIGKK